MKTIIRIAVVVVILIAALLLAPTSSQAGAPTVRTTEVSFVEVNACTGEDHVVDLEYVVTEHLDHQNNFVGRFVATETTSDGYEGRGVGVRTVAGDRTKIVLNYITRSDATGDAYRIHHVLTFDRETGELTSIRTNDGCLGA